MIYIYIFGEGRAGGREGEGKWMEKGKNVKHEGRGNYGIYELGIAMIPL